MADEYLTCPFCGFEFAKEDTLCQHGCPLSPMCGLMRCPSCQYEFADKPRTVSWLGGLLQKRRRAPQDLPAHLVSVRDLNPNEHARVLCLGGGTSSRHNNLAVFGVVPGAEIELLQQRPAPVVRVGETELALDAAIAQEILVERLGDDPEPT
ncbi:MAG: FeoA family protein [Gemmatimonadales bacterium]|jgi:Fe2+ transport system protein FeoA